MVRWSENDSDEALVAASLRQPEAFGAFYRRYVGAVHGFLASRLGDQTAAADLTAEVFAAAVASRGRFDPRRGSAETWIWQIARSKLVDQIRHERVVDRHRRALGMTIDASTDDYDLGGGEQTPALDALQTLPAARRKAVLEHVLEGISHAELAERLDTDPATVRKRVSRGLAALRRSLPESDTTHHPDTEAPHG
jgi:RNA polymerase sigma-70 factor (ECF subfamily)